jgi:hypothetical protein
MTRGRSAYRGRSWEGGGRDVRNDVAACDAANSNYHHVAETSGERVVCGAPVDEV